jgi:hypothetical protein
MHAPPGAAKLDNRTLKYLVCAGGSSQISRRLLLVGGCQGEFTSIASGYVVAE